MNLKISKECDMTSSTAKRPAPMSCRETQEQTVPADVTAQSVVEHFRQYARERPGRAALWCVGVGFVLGWKLKLW